MLEGTVVAETLTLANETGSVSVDVQFPAYTASGLSVATNMQKIGFVRALPNIGLASDSSIEVLETFSTAMQNSLHRKSVIHFF